MRLRFVPIAALVALCASCGSATIPTESNKVQAPVVISRVQPDYPPELREAGVQGNVVITGTVPKEGGSLRDSRVVRSDDARLEPLALAAIARWQFRPGLQDGQAVDVEFTTTVTFHMSR